MERLKEKGSRLAQWAGAAEQCQYVESPSKSVAKTLKQMIRGQDLATDAIVSAIESWEFDRADSTCASPLVLAITGMCFVLNKSCGWWKPF